MNATVRTLATIAAAVALLAVSGTLGANTSEGATTTTTVRQCGYCSELSGEHEFPGYGTNFDCSSDSENPGTCHTQNKANQCSTHNACGRGFDEVSKLAADAAIADANGVRRLLAIYGTKLVYNSARQSIQLLDCAYGVVAAFPISYEADALIERESRLDGMSLSDMAGQLVPESSVPRHH